MRGLPVLAGLFVALALAVLPLPVQADEGQWLPEQLQGLDWTALRERGLELEPDEVWDGEQGLLTAAVNINGCSASFVSGDGLVVTNHHCGFGAIQRASTVEQNYLRDGFIADSFEAEIPSPGMRVSYVTGYEDVTEPMHAAAEAAGDDPAARHRAVQAKQRELATEASGRFSEAIVVPYFEGRIWRRIHRTVLRDVRLVYAPPRAVGEYGGETDNWMWPRHTGDFSFFRAYVSPDGGPAEYSEENVPYQPPRHLEVSEEGAGAGDFVMILGYPGSTQRYLSSVAVAVREEYFYPARLALFTTVIADLERQAAESEEAALNLSSRIKSFSNVEKNARGMIYGLERNQVVARKEREEAEFQAWVDADPGRRERYGDLLERLVALDQAEAQRMPKDFVLDNLARMSRTFGQARRMARDEIGSAPGLIDEHDPARDLLLDMARSLPEDARLAAFDAWEEAGGTDLVALARELEPAYREQAAHRAREAGQRMEIGALWIEAQEKWRGRNFYPDANRTLRVSTATVKGYEPRDGVWHVPHTTVEGVLAKHTGEGEFDVPDEIFAAVARDPDALQVPVCFLADGDTTGGNSGSPVVDGKGRLVGLNFDRVFENVAGDFGWNPQRSRNISVDIRYVLWLMRDVWPAPHLIEEMGLDAQAAAEADSVLKVRVGLNPGDPGHAEAERAEFRGTELRLGAEHRFALAEVAVYPLPDGQRYGIAIEIDADDCSAFHQLTGAHTRRPLAILADGEVVTAPVIQTAIPSRLNLVGGRDGWSRAAAETLARRLEAQRGTSPERDPVVRGTDQVNQGRPTVEVRVVQQSGDAHWDDAEVIQYRGKELRFGPTTSFEVERGILAQDSLGRQAFGLVLLDDAGWQAFTEKHEARQIGIFVDRELISAPVIFGPVPGGTLLIHPSGSKDERERDLRRVREHYASVYSD